MREIYLHIGLPKTGSSALQSFFAKNIDSLRDRGIFYPPADTHLQAEGERHTCGNAQLLFSHLKHGHPAEFFEAINGKANDDESVLLSSELLAGAHPHQIEHLIASIPAGYRLRVICLVRDVYPLLWSFYGQQVKERMLSTPFQEFVVGAGYSHLLVAQRWSDALPDDALRVIHYESCEGDLPGCILREIGVDSTGLAQLCSRVNRGLTPIEVETLSRLNASHRGWLSREVSNALLTRRPAQNATPYYHDVAKLVANRFSSQIVEMNRLFFGAKPVVSLGIPSDTVQPAPPSLQEQLDIERIVADICADIGATKARLLALERAEACQTRNPDRARAIVRHVLQRNPGCAQAVALQQKLDRVSRQPGDGGPAPGQPSVQIRNTAGLDDCDHLNEAVNFIKRTIFIAIPKTGTTSINSQLRPQGIPLIRNPHLNIMQVKDALYIYLLKKNLGINSGFPSDHIDDAHVREEARRVFADFFKFSAVRNPWARAVSLYYRLEGIQISSKMSFENFCDHHMHASDTCLHPTLHKNQIDWLSDENGDIAMDYIYKLEEFETAVKDIFNLTEGRIDLAFLAKNVNSLSSSYSYKEMYSDKTRKLVGKRFEKDIDFFKYSF